MAEPKWIKINFSKSYKFWIFRSWIFVTGGYGYEARLGLDIGKRAVSLVIQNCRIGVREKSIQLRFFRYD